MLEDLFEILCLVLGVTLLTIGVCIGLATAIWAVFY